MDITETKHDQYSIFKLNGRLDSNTAMGFEQKLFECIENGTQRLILDFQDLDYISSAGLSELIDTQNTCKQLNRGELILAEVPPRVREVLNLAGLTPLFKLYDSESEAVGSF